MCVCRKKERPELCSATGMLVRAWHIGPRAAVLILPLYHKSGLLGLYAALTVSDLFFVVFVEFYGVF